MVNIFSILTIFLALLILILQNMCIVWGYTTFTNFIVSSFYYTKYI